MKAQVVPLRSNDQGRQAMASEFVYPERLITRSFAKVAPEAARGVIVHYPRGLHPGVNDDWADKLEAALFELCRDLF
jgi:hypothetical protein